MRDRPQAYRHGSGLRRRAQDARCDGASSSRSRHAPSRTLRPRCQRIIRAAHRSGAFAPTVSEVIDFECRSKSALWPIKASYNASRSRGFPTCYATVTSLAKHAAFASAMRNAVASQAERLHAECVRPASPASCRRSTASVPAPVPNGVGRRASTRIGPTRPRWRTPRSSRRPAVAVRRSHRRRRRRPGMRVPEARALASGPRASCESRKTNAHGVDHAAFAVGRAPRAQALPCVSPAPPRRSPCADTLSPSLFSHTIAGRRRARSRARALHRRVRQTWSARPAAPESSSMANKMLIDATHPEETRVVVRPRQPRRRIRFREPPTASSFAAISISPR